MKLTKKKVSYLSCKHFRRNYLQNISGELSEWDGLWDMTIMTNEAEHAGKSYLHFLEMHASQVTNYMVILNKLFSSALSCSIGGGHTLHFVLPGATAPS